MSDDFNWLDDQEVVDGASIELEMDWITMPNGEFPVLIGRHAGEDNPEFMAELIKQANAASKKKREGIDAKDLQDGKAKERQRYAKHVIKGWRNVVNSSGKPSEFNYENCLAFLSKLSRKNFNLVADFFADESRFTRGSLSSEDRQEAGNGSGPSSNGG